MTLEFVLRSVLFAAGSLLLYAAGFLYPNERGAVHSTLEKWWIRFDDARISTSQRHLRVLRVVAAMGSSAFAAAYGQHLWSRLALNNALLLSLGSVALANGLSLTVLGAITDTEGAPEALLGLLNSSSAMFAGVLISAMGLLVFVAFGLQARRTNRVAAAIANVYLNAVVLSAICVVALTSVVGLLPERRLSVPTGFVLRPLENVSFSLPNIEFVALVIFGWVLGSLADFGVVGIFRGTLGKIQKASVLVVLALMCGSALLAVSLWALPHMPLTYLLVQESTVLATPIELTLVLGVFGDSNLHLALVPVAMLLLAAALLIDRALWPVLARLTYQPIQNNLIENRRALWIAGATLLGASLPWWPRESVLRFLGVD